MPEPNSEEGYALMGAAFEVHNIQRGRLLAEIYQQSLEIELELRGIPFRPKEELKVYCKGRELQKRCIPDLSLFDRMVIELKAVSALAPKHEAQLMNYLRFTRNPIGYLINFGPIGRLQHTRIIPSEFL